MPLILPLWCPRLTGGDIRATGYYPWGLGASNVSPFHASLAPGVDQTTFKFQPKTSEKMANRIIIIAVRVCEWVQWWLVGRWGGWALYYQIGSWQFLCVVVPQLQLQLQLHLRLEFKSETEPRSCTSSLAEAVASMEALLVTRDLVTWGRVCSATRRLKSVRTQLLQPVPASGHSNVSVSAKWALPQWALYAQQQGGVQILIRKIENDILVGTFIHLAGTTLFWILPSCVLFYLLGPYHVTWLYAIYVECMRCIAVAAAAITATALGVVSWRAAIWNGKRKKK